MIFTFNNERAMLNRRTKCRVLFALRLAHLGSQSEWFFRPRLPDNSAKWMRSTNSTKACASIKDNTAQLPGACSLTKKSRCWNLIFDEAESLGPSATPGAWFPLACCPATQSIRRSHPVHSWLSFALLLSFASSDRVGAYHKVFKGWGRLRRGVCSCLVHVQPGKEL